MTSSENLTTMEPWGLWTTFSDSWISDAVARDTETLTKALQKSFSDRSETVTSDTISPSINIVKPETTSLQIPNLSGSDPETAAMKRRNLMSGPAGGKITKRKSRASKRMTTTFIMADAANFRQMVQQVTGVRFGGGNGQLSVPPVLKPEPQRAFNRLQGCMPTLDTSAFLLDHHQQVLGSSSSVLVSPEISVPPPMAVVDGGASFEFESFSTFPTLESWKVM